MTTMGSWKEIVDHYAKTCSVLVLDNRGIGHSTTGSSLIPERYTTKGMAKDLITLLEHIDWTTQKSVNLIGCSMGGMIALEAAFLYPSIFKSLLLCATCAVYRNPPTTVVESLVKIANFVRPKWTIQEQLGNIYILKSDVLLEELYSDKKWLDKYDTRFPEFKCNRQRMENKFRTIFQKSKSSSSLYTLFGQSMAVLTHNISPSMLDTIGTNIPTTAVVGTLDKVINPSCTYDFENLVPGCRVIRFEGKGHGIPNESEEELIMVLNNILDL
jgi:pimeloyl-ACP methyl ester carboxylesterase